MNIYNTKVANNNIKNEYLEEFNFIQNWLNTYISFIIFLLNKYYRYFEVLFMIFGYIDTSFFRAIQYYALHNFTPMFRRKINDHCH